MFFSKLDSFLTTLSKQINLLLYLFSVSNTPASCFVFSKNSLKICQYQYSFFSVQCWSPIIFVHTKYAVNVPFVEHQEGHLSGSPLGLDPPLTE